MINAIADFFQNLFSPVVNILGYVLLFFHLLLHYTLKLYWITVAVNISFAIGTG